MLNMIRTRAVGTSRVILYNRVLRNYKVNNNISFSPAPLVRAITKTPSLRDLEGGDSVRGYTVSTKHLTERIECGDSVRGYAVAKNPFTSRIIRGGDSVRGYTVATKPLTTRTEGGDSVRGYTALSI